MRLDMERKRRLASQTNENPVLSNMNGFTEIPPAPRPGAALPNPSLTPVTGITSRVSWEEKLRLTEWMSPSKKKMTHAVVEECPPERDDDKFVSELEDEELGEDWGFLGIGGEGPHLDGVGSPRSKQLEKLAMKHLKAQIQQLEASKPPEQPEGEEPSRVNEKPRSPTQAESWKTLEKAKLAVSQLKEEEEKKEDSKVLSYMQSRIEVAKAPKELKVEWGLSRGPAPEQVESTGQGGKARREGSGADAEAKLRVEKQSLSEALTAGLKENVELKIELKGALGRENQMESEIARLRDEHIHVEEVTSW